MKIICTKDEQEQVRNLIDYATPFKTIDNIKMFRELWEDKIEWEITDEQSSKV